MSLNYFLHVKKGCCYTDLMCSSLNFCKCSVWTDHVTLKRGQENLNLCRSYIQTTSFWLQLEAFQSTDCCICKLLLSRYSHLGQKFISLHFPSFIHSSPLSLPSPPPSLSWSTEQWNSWDLTHRDLPRAPWQMSVRVAPSTMNSGCLQNSCGEHKHKQTDEVLCSAFGDRGAACRILFSLF